MFIEIRKGNQLLKKIELKDVTEDNDLFYLEAALVNTVLERNKTKGEKKQLWPRGRRESQVRELRD